MTAVVTGPRAANRTQQRPQQAAKSNLPSLTGMRWMAALLVFGLHVHNFGYFAGRGQTFVSWGFDAGDTGVSFFFVLSGFVLMWSARPNDKATGFWRRRFARIYPVHFVTVILALLMAYTMAPAMKPTGEEAAANLLLVHSWVHAWWQTLDPVSWSLACEAFFYALFPALAWALRKLPARALTAVTAACVLTVLALPWVNTHFNLGWDIYAYPLARVPEFILGAAAARLVLLGRWRGPRLEASLAVTIIGYFLAPKLGDGPEHVAGTIVGFALLIPAAACADLKGEPSMWRHRILVRLGELSFAFYMIHLLVLHAGEHLFASSPHLPAIEALAAAGVAFAISLALAWVLYEGVERPGRRLLLRSRRRRRPVAAAAATAESTTAAATAGAGAGEA
ncbi:acyltransferase [Streptomyces sp. RB6PN25]|uniref:Acyltransferase n=1 Tax=Streptomyces humicola TaxID=2953240 RepID=A0ABT1PXZ5_9ACTN|nr:acyltransferase [Streptomyces humicola]MCQ4082544.1 acyltransferase [Streptomyces humicola]